MRQLIQTLCCTTIPLIFLADSLSAHEGRHRFLPGSQSGWIAVRAQGVPHPDQPTGNQVCHASPVYVEVRDRPLNSRTEAQYFLKWVDRLEEDLRRRDRVPMRHREHLDEQLEQAREMFRQLAG
ncbi:MAG TPA: hypothetical protein DCG12_06825 [Planctomycetaceae bacterium]|nr:hypothetical protein [Planctomycetaceae bacterium]